MKQKKSYSIFFSETRVDFRTLVKELAATHKARIELRQIGVRDVSSIIGGIGTCGKQICCASGFYKCDSISIQLAKDQKLNLNSSKISGLCGRLKCCLEYESWNYLDNQIQKLPSIGTVITIDKLNGEIQDINYEKSEVMVITEDEAVHILPFSDFPENYKEEDLIVINRTKK